jgi:hypothetical protein
MKRVMLLPLVFLAVCVPSEAQKKPSTPAPNSPERKAIMNALRAPVEKQLKRKVIFKVDELRVQNGWAFLRGVPQQPGDKAMDYRGTPYDEARKAGAFDDWICALLRKKGSGSKAKWRVVTYQIGATDVPYDGWDKEYKVPSALFGIRR